MKRHQQMAAILLALFLVLAVVVYLVEFRPPAEETEAQRMWDLKPAEVVSLAVRDASGLAYRMERDDVGIWRIVEPSPSEADQKRIAWLIEDLAAIEPIRQFAPGEVALEEVGLLTPTATAVVGVQGGGEYVLEVGAPGLQPYTQYVRWGETVYLCTSEVPEKVVNLLKYPPVLQPTPTPVAASGARNRGDACVAPTHPPPAGAGPSRRRSL